MSVVGYGVGEDPCRSVISIKLQSNFIEITFYHSCSPVNFVHFVRRPFYKNPPGGLLLHLQLVIIWGVLLALSCDLSSPFSGENIRK